MTIEINSKKLVQTIANDITVRTPSSSARGGKCKHLKVEDEDGNKVILRLPYTTAVEMSDTSETYFVEVDGAKFYLQTVYSIAYTREHANPLVQCVFMLNKYNTHLVVLEANTYKIVNNSFVRQAKLKDHDKTHGYRKTKVKRY